MLQETADVIRRQILENWDADQVYEPAVRQQLEQQFTYQYPYEGVLERKLKFTVSELKKRAYLMEEGADVEELGETAYEEPEVIPLIPRFLEESEELTGASRGTAYHRVMELLDLSETYTEEEVREAIRDFREEGRISEEMADCIRVKDIRKVLESSLGQRLRAAARKGRIWKEQPLSWGS